jgi:hypothetical protein
MPTLSAGPWILVALAADTLASLAAGSVVVRAASGAASFSPAARLASAYLLGQGLLAALWLLLALAAALSPPAIGVSVALALLAGAPSALRLARGLPGQLESAATVLRHESGLWRAVPLAALLLAAAGGTTLGRSVLGDASAFYLAVGKAVAASHRLVPLPGYESFTQIGLLAEMHYAALMALGVPDAAPLVAWPVLLATAILVGSLAGRVGCGSRGRWLAVSCLLTSTAALAVLGDGKVDLWGAALGLAAASWALVPGGSFLAGLFFGFSLVAKLSNLLGLAPALGLLLLWRARGDRSLRPVTAFAVGTALAVAPHVLKNALLFSQPLAPFWAASGAWADQTWFGPATTRRLLLTYPLALTFGEYWAQLGHLSPLVLAYLPLAFFLPRPGRWRDSLLTWVSMAGATGLAAWLLLRPSVLAPRYFLATLLLLVPLAARAAEHASLGDPARRRLGPVVTTAALVVLTTTMLNGLGAWFFPTASARVFAGTARPCERFGPYCRVLVELSKEAGPGDRVLLLSYHRYWLRPDLLQCVSRSLEEQSLRSSQSSPEERWREVVQRGFRYLVADPTTHQATLDALEPENAPPWLALTPVFRRGRLEAWRLDLRPGAPTAFVSCRQTAPPAWDIVGAP